MVAASGLCVGRRSTGTNDDCPLSTSLSFPRSRGTCPCLWPQRWPGRPVLLFAGRTGPARLGAIPLFVMAASELGPRAPLPKGTLDRLTATMEALQQRDGSFGHGRTRFSLRGLGDVLRGATDVGPGPALYGDEAPSHGTGGRTGVVVLPGLVGRRQSGSVFPRVDDPGLRHVA